jgi:hypothetical protein
MTQNFRSIRVLVLAIVLVGALQPATTFAQIGITGDSLSGQTAEREGRNSQFDKNFKSKSALGQLEEMTGATVDRSSSQYSNRNSNTCPAPRPKPAQPRYDPNREIRQQIAGTVADILIGALFADNSAQEKAAAEAAAARAAAEAEAQAEAFRVQQELIRWARIQRAQSYRADWDSREGEITGRLGGAFDVGTGTAFFGRPANPDADVVAAILGQDAGGAKPTADDDAAGVVDSPDVPDSDPSVVDLRGSSLVVQPSHQSTPVAMRGRSPALPRSPKQAQSNPGWARDWADTGEEVSEERPLREIPSMKNAVFFNDWFGETLTNTATATALGLIPEYLSKFPNLPLRGLVTSLVGFKEDFENIGNPLKKKAVELVGLAGTGSQQVISIMRNPYSGAPIDGGNSFFGSVTSTGDEIREDASYQALDVVSSKVLSSPDMSEAFGRYEVEARDFSHFQSSNRLHLRDSALGKLFLGK